MLKSGRSTGTNVLLRVTKRHKEGEEECALGMVQKSNDVVAKDVRIKLRREECASNMGQRVSANTMDALIMLRREECASSMGQSSNDVAVKVAQIKAWEEDCA